jgi:hypothetical protein
VVINLTVSRMRVQITTLMIVAATLGGSLKAVPASANTNTVIKVRDGLHLQDANIPTMHEGYVFVSGTVPQIDYNYLSFEHRSSPSSRNVLRINSGIEGLATTSEKSYWKTLVKFCTPQAKSFSDLEKEPGDFGTTLNSELILANNATLSFVIPTFNSICQGTGNEGAISSTYSLQSGKPINLLSLLFTNRLAGERLLAKLASDQFYEGKSVGDRCIQHQGGAVSLKAMLAYVEKANALGVTHVALGKKGIVVLIDQCYLTACACGDSFAAIPYAKVWNSLSERGKDLLLGVG